MDGDGDLDVDPEAGHGGARETESTGGSRVHPMRSGGGAVEDAVDGIVDLAAPTEHHLPSSTADVSGSR